MFSILGFVLFALAMTGAMTLFYLGKFVVFVFMLGVLFAGSWIAVTGVEYAANKCFDAEPVGFAASMKHAFVLSTLMFGIGVSVFLVSALFTFS